MSVPSLVSLLPQGGLAADLYALEHFSGGRAGGRAGGHKWAFMRSLAKASIKSPLGWLLNCVSKHP
jgi:hypothetical protein